MGARTPASFSNGPGAGCSFATTTARRPRSDRPRRRADATAVGTPLKRYGIDAVWVLMGVETGGTVGVDRATRMDRKEQVRRAVTMPHGAPASLPPFDAERLAPAQVDQRLLDGFA